MPFRSDMHFLLFKRGTVVFFLYESSAGPYSVGTGDDYAYFYSYVIRGGVYEKMYYYK